MKGRLELTWTNKDQALLTTSEGKYEWVPPADHRVSEIRLLHTVESVGEVPTQRASANLLVRGDALHGLRALKELPEFAAEYLGQVRVAYLDPPFNTGQMFPDYDDALEHSVWLTVMRDRLVQIRSLLSADGSVWVHLDDREVHRCRSLLDEVFGSDNSVATFIWEKTDIPAMQAGVSVRHDYILVYQKTDEFSPNGTEVDDVPDHYNLVDEEGRAYCLRTLRMTGPGSRRADRPTMWFPIPAPDGTPVLPIRSDGTEGRWRWSEPKVKRSPDQLEWQQTDGRWEVYRRIYADTERKRPPETLLNYESVGSNRTAKAEARALFPGVQAFATPKPERLMQRILEIASDPGDVVLDCFAGSGTTAAVAHKLGRRWVTIEASADTVANYTLPRLTKVVQGDDAGGVSARRVAAVELPDSVTPAECKVAATTLDALRDTDLLDQDDDVIEAIIKSLRSAGRMKSERVFEGGGGFVVLDIGPSMFEEIDGRIYLAEWAANGALAEATAAQLKYMYETDPPFCGRKGRSRLAVIDGLVNEAVVRLLVDALPPDEKLCVAGTALDPLVRELLASLRPGSVARKVPDSLLDEYRQSRRSHLQLASMLDGQAEERAS